MLEDGTIYALDHADEAWDNESKNEHEWPSDTPVLIPVGSAVLKGDAMIDMKGGKPKKYTTKKSKEHKSKEKTGGEDAEAALFERHLDGDEEHHQNHRRLNDAIGDKTFLAVRVMGRDKVYGYSEDQLRLDVFGLERDGRNLGKDEFNLKVGFEQCSYNKFTVTPAPNRNNINLGVLTVNVDMKVKKGGDKILVNAAIEEIKDMFDIKSPNEIADHVMLCLPDGSMSKFIICIQASVYIINLSQYIFFSLLL